MNRQKVRVEGMGVAKGLREILGMRVKGKEVLYSYSLWHFNPWELNHKLVKLLGVHDSCRERIEM